MTTTPSGNALLPDLTTYDAVLFDLDGVLTPTADVHMHAWKLMFTELFAAWGVAKPYLDEDYFLYLDGMQRYEGVSRLLASRGIELPWGSPEDAPTAETVCGVGNRKNIAFAETLAREGVEPYAGSVAMLDVLDAAGVPKAVVSSSKNAEAVLTAAGLRERFGVVVDGAVAEVEGLPSKPAPDMFLLGATRLGVDPSRAVVVEDATSGVAAGAVGGFGLVLGVDRGAGADALLAAGAGVVVSDLSELLSADSAAE
ncbi:beta-phosphoglucomutase family hydrolase [Labedella populi]|uniref:Beta-phosphoglucomutase n=1 Tax=Labedella populi TaxID=2498850 RepID=A0A444QG17_9MICO|nr:beta-phosphoglucomutase family hydrolase [Labedella populi]RWZ68495.1 beta-phosphoglucomutase family hydrolase [Labedella populi]